ncbi:unnamed protein product, partial [Ostreobium quekettii]
VRRDPLKMRLNTGPFPLFVPVPAGYSPVPTKQFIGEWGPLDRPWPQRAFVRTCHDHDNPVNGGDDRLWHENCPHCIRISWEHGQWYNSREPEWLDRPGTEPTWPAAKPGEAAPSQWILEPKVETEEWP